MTNYQPAKVHPTSFIFNSPSKSVAFNIKLTNNDGLLVDHIARTEQIGHFQAERKIAEFVHHIQSALAEHKPVKLAGIGRLIMDVENNIQFLADNSHNFLMQSYGLYSFTAQPVARENVESVRPMEVIKVDKTVKKKKSTDALLPIAAVLLLTMLTMQIFIQSSMNGFNYSEIFGFQKVFTKNNFLLEKYEPVRFEINPSILYFRKTDSTAVNSNEITQTNIIPAVTQNVTNNTSNSSAYFISAGSFYSEAEAEIVITKLREKGYDGYVKVWGKYKVAAVNIPEGVSATSFRTQFISATGIKDAWVSRNR